MCWFKTDLKKSHVKKCSKPPGVVEGDHHVWCVCVCVWLFPSFKDIVGPEG